MIIITSLQVFCHTWCSLHACTERSGCQPARIAISLTNDFALSGFKVLPVLQPNNASFI